ncbi:MAG: cellulase family glycosylhydrolase [Chloroflexi bacterium]|nr:cellulase family glycosylhydrolase [Chloroflexota bacterium]
MRNLILRLAILSVSILFIATLIAPGSALAFPSSPCGLENDLNGDGVVDVKDLKIAVTEWRTDPNSTFYDTSGLMGLITDLNVAHCDSTTFPLGIVFFNEEKGQGGASIASAGGIRYVRWWMEWKGIEGTAPVNGQHTYYWNSLDRELQDLINAGLTPILTIQSVPAWAARTAPSSSCGPIDTDQLQNFASVVAAAAQRYDHDGVNDGPTTVPIRFFELFNEADNSNQSNVSLGGCWGNYGSRYADVLKAVYPAVKAVSPNTQIVFSSIAYDLFYNPPSGYDAGGCNSNLGGPSTACPFNYNFMTDALSRLKADPNAAANHYYFDYMGFHQYDFARLYWNGQKPLDQSMLGKVKKMRDRMASVDASLNTKPFASTEFGLRIGNPPTEEAQKRHAIQGLVQSLAAKLPFSLWYTLRDRPGELLYGLFRSGSGFSNPRPAYYALQMAAAQLDGWTFDSQIVASDVNIQAFAFAKAGQPGRKIVAWWDDGSRKVNQSQTSTATLRVNATLFGTWTGKVKTTYHVNNSLSTVTTDQSTGSSYVDVTFTSNPVFIEVTP